jgi:hypothetical protein
MEYIVSSGHSRMISRILATDRIKIRVGHSRILATGRINTT